jgi:acetylglutamate/LysW-gamma-L-alpha-aminoadipate kinase
VVGVTVVVKVGGGRAVDPGPAVTDVAHLMANDEDVVVVHGGSTAVDDALADFGLEPEYVESPSGMTGRFTDREAMDVFEMAMGKVNTDLVATFQNAGVPAVGLNGVDAGLLTGPRKSAVKVVEGEKTKIRRGDHSGRIESVNTDLLAAQFDAGYVPVVSVPMLAEEGTPVNADADRAAAAIAGALEASLVVLTDVAGVYEDPDDETTLVESVDSPEAMAAVEDAAEGFMSKKVLAAGEALEGGAAGVVVADANQRDPVVRALGGQVGTRFDPEAVA